MQIFLKKLMSALLALTLAFSCCACGTQSPEAVQPGSAQAPVQGTAVAGSTGNNDGGDAETADEESLPALPTEASHFAGQILISEVMTDNRATLRDSDGDFSDWVELSNCGSTSVNLSGWRLSDDPEEAGWQFPAVSIGPGEQILVYTDKKDRTDDELHTDFALSKKESLTLRDSELYPVAFAADLSGKADYSSILTADGSYEVCDRPTPGFANTSEGLSAYQETLAVGGPLYISEVMTGNYTVSYPFGVEGYRDWVELANSSEETIDLSVYYLSDDADELQKYRLQGSLYPGGYLVVLCDDSFGMGGYLCTGFGLDAESEQLYLSDAEGNLVDYLALRHWPYTASFGRQIGQNGLFYFTVPTPCDENRNGGRSISAAPVADLPGGVYENVESLSVTLEGSGKIYYTLDSSLPTADSTLYAGPIELTETTVLRAITVEDGCISGSPMTVSYLINEGLSLPAVSLVSNNPGMFNMMYYGGMKGVEEPGMLSYYGPDGSFTAGCGIKMHGATSLALNKKNVSIRFRSAFGSSSVNFDLFGGGVTEFTNLLLRAGQDQLNCLIRDELGTALAMDFTDKLIVQRFRYCVLFVNGQYQGIFALKEKANEQLYASTMGVSKSSVTLLDANVPANTEWYRDVMGYCETHDMSLTENYARFCEVFDVESLIDWVVVEGFEGNSDLFSGNTRYARSTEGDGKWRMVLYDLDSIFTESGNVFMNLLGPEAQVGKQAGILLSYLTQNEQFRNALLTRAGEALQGPFSDEAVVAKIDELCAMIDAEVSRDVARNGSSHFDWAHSIEYLKNTISSGLWRQLAVENLTSLFSLTEEEQNLYFGAVS